MGSPIRIGAVSYLNAKPLILWALRICSSGPAVDGCSQPACRAACGRRAGCRIDPIGRVFARGQPVVMRSSLALRSRLADQSGVLSCSAGCRGTRSGGWRSMPGRGPARFWHGSGSTRAMAYVRTQVEELPLGVSALESTADAVLLIGDRAMRVPGESFHDVVDLGEAWHTLTGLPFVFALWVARRWRRSGRLAGRLGTKPGGRAGSRADSLARLHGPRLGLDFADVLRLPDAHLILRPRRARDCRA